MKPNWYNPKTPNILELYSHFLLLLIEPCLASSRIIKAFFCDKYKIQSIKLITNYVHVRSEHESKEMLFLRHIGNTCSRRNTN